MTTSPGPGRAPRAEVRISGLRHAYHNARRPVLRGFGPALPKLGEPEIAIAKDQPRSRLRNARHAPVQRTRPPTMCRLRVPTPRSGPRLLPVVRPRGPCHVRGAGRTPALTSGPGAAGRDR